MAESRSAALRRWSFEDRDETTVDDRVRQVTNGILSIRNDVAGVALGAAALLTVLLRVDGRPVPDLIQGRFDSAPHWWLELNGQRLDPTRGQFDQGPTVSCRDRSYRDEDAPLLASWSTGQAILEFGRVYPAPAVGQQHARMLLRCWGVLDSRGRPLADALV